MFYYFAPGRGMEYCAKRVCLSVCLSVCEHTSRTTRANFTKFSTHVAYGRGSVFFRRPCNTLCTSGFLDDVMFLCRGPNVDVSL